MLTIRVSDDSGNYFEAEYDSELQAWKALRRLSYGIEDYGWLPTLQVLQHEATRYSVAEAAHD